MDCILLLLTNHRFTKAPRQREHTWYANALTPATAAPVSSPRSKAGVPPACLGIIQARLDERPPPPAVAFAAASRGPAT